MKTNSLFIILLLLSITGCNFQSGNKTVGIKGNGTLVETHRELSAREIYESSIDKVAMLLCYDNGLPISQGSGFFVNENTLITNYHVIEGANLIEIKLPTQEEVFKGAKIIKASEDFDIAIIQTKQSFSFLQIDSTDTDNIGSKIYCIGNPRGFEGTISEGILSGKRENEGIEFIQITAPISPGNSGGPVINNKGEVIGISTFTYKNSQNLNFAMPIKYISKCTDYIPKPKGKAKQVLYGMDPQAVTMVDYNGPTFGDGSISLKNNTSDYIKEIRGIIIFRKMSGEVFDFSYVTRHETVPPGLAHLGFAPKPGSPYVYYKSMEGYDYYNNVTKYKVEFRLLTYEIEE